MNNELKINKVHLLFGWCTSLIGTISFGIIFGDLLLFSVLLVYGLFNLVLISGRFSDKWQAAVGGLIAFGVLGGFFFAQLLPFLPDLLWSGGLLILGSTLLIACLGDWLGIGRWG